MGSTKVKKKAGRISPTPMGDYDNATVYRRLDWVYYGGTSYICKKNNTVGIIPTNISNWQKLLDPPSDTPIYFDEVTTRENISSGEKLSVILGKIKKCISEIKNVAFSGSYNDLSDKPNSLKNPNALNIKFNGTSKASYDGSVAKEVNVTPDAISAINTSTILTTKEQISANTNAANVTGALAAKAMMADINAINSNLTTKLITPKSVNNDWISTGYVYCYKILDRYVIYFSEISFKKLEDFGYKTVMLWDFDLPGTTWTVFTLTSIWNNDILRLVSEGGKIYGHHDLPVAEAVYYGMVII